MEDLIPGPIKAAKSMEAGSLFVNVTECKFLSLFVHLFNSLAFRFYRSVTSEFCSGKGEDDEFACGGHAVVQKFLDVRFESLKKSHID